MASVINDALLEIAVPISCEVAPVLSSPPLVPSPLLLLFAGESECSLVSESELSHNQDHKHFTPTKPILQNLTLRNCPFAKFKMVIKNNMSNYVTKFKTLF